MFHIFIDASSLMPGAAALASRFEGESYEPTALRLCWSNLVQLAERGRRPIRTRFAGSYPESLDPECLVVARSRSYDARFLEQGVGQESGYGMWDGFLDLTMRAAIESFRPTQHLVLLGLDGDSALDDETYRGAFLFVLSRGWHVEVVSWSAHVSARLRTLASDLSLLSITELDGFYRQVTAVGGQRECSPLDAPM